MAERGDEAQRTEEPTQKRLDEARRKGDAPRSQEIVAVAMFAAALIGLWAFAAPAAGGLATLGAAFLDRPHEFATDPGALQALFASVSLRMALAVGAVALLFVAAAVVSHVAQARPVLNFERLAPQLSKLSPVEGFKRIYGPAAAFNFLKGLFKLIIVGAILVYSLWPDRTLLIGLMHTDERRLLSLASGELVKLFGFAAAAMTAIAAADYAFARRSWKKRLRMTKEEVRRELKETEGDPIIRGRLRRERDTRARRRMMAAVKDATVLIMNPTHYAVALRYQPDADRAPVCIAKGLDDLALRLRQTADAHGVPVVENPPLARALHAGAEIDAEIPVEHYEAVAQVLGFILRKGGEARPAGA